MKTVSDDAVALVALLRVTGLSRPGLAEHLERTAAVDVLADELGAASRLLPDDPAPHLARARREVATWARSGFTVVGVGDAAYPDALRAVHDRPPALFVAGDVALLGAAPAIAIVGTRRATRDGRDRAARLAIDLVAAGYTIASGLAAGIDTAAHRAAIDCGGRTFAVVGTGLGTAYPPENAELQARIAREHAVVSGLWPEAPPDADNFRRRNGLMSALSAATIIVEASARSGTRIQARRALGHGRPVFLVEKLLRQSWAVDLATRPGVHVVGTAADVIGVLARSTGAPTEPTTPTGPVTPTPPD